MYGALVWSVALLVGITAAGDGPMGLVLTLGGMAVLVGVAVGVTIVPRRLRWRGEVRPRDTVPPSFDPGRPLKPAQIAVEERWGVTRQIADRGWVREVGQLSWWQATVYSVGDETGLVVDPWLLSRRAYVFDGSCHVGPSPTPETLNPGFNLRRKNGVLRVSQGAQVIDLAVPVKSLPAVALVGASGPTGQAAVGAVEEVVGTAVAVSEERLARIARADRRAARRHAFFARINARSKTHRWVAAACSLLYLMLAVGVFMASVPLGQSGSILPLVALLLLGAAGVYAGRVIFRDQHEWPPEWKPRR